MAVLERTGTDPVQGVYSLELLDRPELAAAARTGTAVLEQLLRRGRVPDGITAGWDIAASQAGPQLVLRLTQDEFTRSGVFHPDELAGGWGVLGLGLFLTQFLGEHTRQSLSRWDAEPLPVEVG